MTIEYIAALYAEVIVLRHFFIDGNKRTALLTMLTFIDHNNYHFDAPEDEAENMIVELTVKHINRGELIKWLVIYIRL